jgi:hypothetical protein
MMFEIDFETCYETLPCRHDVTVINTNGEKHIKSMSAPDIVDLIIEHKIPIKVRELSHFKYCFCKTEHYDYLNKIIDENKNKLKYLSLETNGSKIYTTMHVKPLITHTARIFRRTTVDLQHIIKIDKINNHHFMINYDVVQEKINVDYYFCLDIFCIKDDNKMYPNKLTIKYQGIELNYYGKCMKSYLSHFKEMFSFPLYLNDDIEITTDEEVDTMYCKLMPYNNKSSEHQFKDYWENKEIPVFFHEEIHDLSTENSYYKNLYISHDDFSNLESISLFNDDRIFLDNVNISLLKIEHNLLCIPLGFGEHCGRYFSNTENNKIIYHLKDNTKAEEKYTIYGEKFGKISGN